MGRERIFGRLPNHLKNGMIKEAEKGKDGRAERIFRMRPVAKKETRHSAIRERAICLEKEDRAMYWNFGWGWGMGIGCIATLLLWILIILGIVFLVRAILRSERKGTIQETALDILKRRYAKGEISKEEFEEMKKNIQ